MTPILKQPPKDVVTIYIDGQDVKTAAPNIVDIINYVSEANAINMVSSLQIEHERYATWATAQIERLKLEVHDLIIEKRKLQQPNVIDVEQYYDTCKWTKEGRYWYMGCLGYKGPQFTEVPPTSICPGCLKEIEENDTNA